MILGALAEWDHAILRWVNSHHHPALDWVLAPVSFVGEAGAIWVLAGLALIILGRGRARVTGALLLAAMLVADRLTAATLRSGEAPSLRSTSWSLGEILQRHRPYLDEPHLRQIGIRWAGNSFPSAHAHSVVIAAIMLGSEYRRLLPILVPFALLTLYARPYLGMHHPLDTLAGVAVGAVVGGILVAIRHRWDKAPAVGQDAGGSANRPA